MEGSLARSRCYTPHPWGELCVIDRMEARARFLCLDMDGLLGRRACCVAHEQLNLEPNPEIIVRLKVGEQLSHARVSLREFANQLCSLSRRCSEEPEEIPSQRLRQSCHVHARMLDERWYDDRL